MAGRFPRARNVAEFWRNIRDGVECISRFSIEELEVPGCGRTGRHPDYVRARSTIEDADCFDAAFFGILPKEAELIDPQQRVFLECCWEAIEDAGYDPQAYPGAIAVYAGCSPNTYFLRNLCVDRDFIEEYTGAYQVGHYPTLLGTNPDFLATRVSYKLNLKGPSFTIQCGCSTSLVAVCQACQSLLSLPERHGPGRRRLDHVSPETRLLLPRRGDGVARRSLPDVRSPTPRARSSAVGRPLSC